VQRPDALVAHHSHPAGDPPRPEQRAHIGQSPLIKLSLVVAAGRADAPHAGARCRQAQGFFGHLLGSAPGGINVVGDLGVGDAAGGEQLTQAGGGVIAPQHGPAVVAAQAAGQLIGFRVEADDHRAAALERLAVGGVHQSAAAGGDHQPLPRG